MAEPQGSTYDAAHKRRASRKLGRRIRGWFTWHMVGLCALVFPVLYLAYCRFVWWTSTIEDELTGPLMDGLDRHDRFVSLIWHQEVFTVAFAFKHFHGHTVASTGNFGRIITRMLEACNFTVFRGGSSSGRARRKRILVDMIRHMREVSRVPYGITVDGSNGPPFKLKRGAVVIARACGAPIFGVRTWYSRCLQLSTWDRSAIPLPFGTIRMQAIGPYWVSPEGGEFELEDAVAHLQSELHDLVSYAYQRVDHLPYGYSPEGFPEDWRPRWQPGTVGLRRTPWDLDPQNPPPFAHLKDTTQGDSST